MLAFKFKMRVSFVAGVIVVTAKPVVIGCT
jgi:hypothetical protein